MANLKKNTYTQRVSIGTSGQAIIVSHISYDAMGFGIQRQGIVPVQIPEGKTKEDMLRLAAGFKWNLVGEANRLNNFVPTVTRGEQLSDELLEEALVTKNSISVELEVEETEAIEQNS